MRDNELEYVKLKIHNSKLFEVVNIEKSPKTEVFGDKLYENYLLEN